jgi:hypothetical protein
VREDEDYQDVIDAEEARVEKLMRASEIWEAGFLVGLSVAGLQSHAAPVYRKWLLARAEANL